MTEDKFFKGTKNFLKTHLCDTTALLTASTPLFAGLEVSLAGMSVETSTSARIMGALLGYAGMGRLFTKGLDVSRNLLKIKPETKEIIKQIHDISYAAAYNAVIGPAFYYAVGVRDLKQIAIGTGIGVGLSLVAGAPMGYAVDAFRDLAGIKSSERIPKIVSKQSPNMKKSLMAILAAASIGLTAGVYSVKNYIHNYSTPAEIHNSQIYSEVQDDRK